MSWVVAPSNIGGSAGRRIIVTLMQPLNPPLHAPNAGKEGILKREKQRHSDIMYRKFHQSRAVRNGKGNLSHKARHRAHFFFFTSFAYPEQTAKVEKCPHFLMAAKRHFQTTCLCLENGRDIKHVSFFTPITHKLFGCDRHNAKFSELPEQSLMKGTRTCSCCVRTWSK